MSACGIGFICNIYGKKSHKIVQLGIEAVKNLTHRGAVGADGKTGDGSGILIQIPKEFFFKEINQRGFNISDIDNLAIGFFFLYKDIEHNIENIFKEYGIKTIVWRDVPVNEDAIGESAKKIKPKIKQLIIDTADIDPLKRELLLYLIRRHIEKRFPKDIYISSLSSNTIVYKGMLIAPQLDRFYPDLQRYDFESAFCIFHQRFSTNTFSDWTMAQPLRIIAHNGEINTIQGNRNWMTTIEHELWHEVFADKNELLSPLVSYEESDSSTLDRVLELLIHAGYKPEHALYLCIPPAWENSELDPKVKAFFEYQSFLMKPWDGPSAIVFHYGDKVGAKLDRNGLRPFRYVLTEDGLMIGGSEAGMIIIDEKIIKEKGRLGPGEMLLVDLKKGVIKFNDEITHELANKKPYEDWINRFLFRLKDSHLLITDSDEEILRKQIAFGYTSEEIETSLKDMAETGKEMVFSMGDDTPIPPLSEKPQLLFRYFKQKFAQVTNPPIDPIRERMVMSLKMNLGYKGNFLVEMPEHAKRLQIDSPILFENHIEIIEDQKVINVKRIDLTFSKALLKEKPLYISVKELQGKVIEAVKKGSEIIILSDKGISKDLAAIPSLLAVSASFKALQRERLANRVSLIVETGEARDSHHMACLIGYGASAVYPYLLFLTIKEMCDRGVVKVSYDEALYNCKQALEEGILKVISRMGISTLNSYHGAQLFDILCLNKDFVDDFFGGIPVFIEADGIKEIEESLLKRHDLAFESDTPVLDVGGELRHKKGGQWHAWSTSAVISINKFIKTQEYKDYEEFSRIVNERPLFIRHLLSFKKGLPIPISEVESEESILKRFFSGAMSIGALSPEAHETIAEACNRLGIKSNSGEGGEDSKRYNTIKNSAIKQIASGRFGVTPTYLASANELEIKIAQGAKPGEGGHLPAKKVTDYIAMLRHCSPNILLISPPPHHDIYSIEDLAQLINDLKEANPSAKICVKLVSEAGVGTVAAGVAKANADIIQISGCEGGTGAASLSSIKNAGSFWEIGLFEAHNVLIENGLRERVRLRVDGGIRTARDVITAALLGAEEFGFGTATMLSAGCVMARQCHLNTCPKGIATQDERLRKRFTGTIQGVMAYFRAVAHETRLLLSDIGVKSLDDIVGRTDLLIEALPEGAKRINLKKIFDLKLDQRQRKCTHKRNDNPSFSMNEIILKDILPFIEKAKPIEREYEIRNFNRSIPVRLNYYISKYFGDEGLPPNTIKLTFRGIAGQSFGAFNHKGLTLILIGEANDYAGKGMFGGRIIIKSLSKGMDVVVGNTVLYGAVGGEFYASGMAGERFAVRNSGALAIVEGAGHHLAEYMTGGTVVVIGKTGYNIGAGMTGGQIYILDIDDSCIKKINTSYVTISAISSHEEDRLYGLIEDHYRYTESLRAKEILDNFSLKVTHFKKVIPLITKGL